MYKSQVGKNVCLQTIDKPRSKGSSMTFVRLPQLDGGGSIDTANNLPATELLNVLRWFE